MDFIVAVAVAVVTKAALHDCRATAAARGSNHRFLNDDASIERTDLRVNASHLPHQDVPARTYILPLDLPDFLTPPGIVHPEPVIEFLPNPVVDEPFWPAQASHHRQSIKMKPLYDNNGKLWAKFPKKKHLVEIVPLKPKTKLGKRKGKSLAYILPNVNIVKNKALTKPKILAAVEPEVGDIVLDSNEDFSAYDTSDTKDSSDNEYSDSIEYDMSDSEPEEYYTIKPHVKIVHNKQRNKKLNNQLDSQEIRSRINDLIKYFKNKDVISLDRSVQSASLENSIIDNPNKRNRLYKHGHKIKNDGSEEQLLSDTNIDKNKIEDILSVSPKTVPEPHYEHPVHDNHQLISNAPLNHAHGHHNVKASDESSDLQSYNTVHDSSYMLAHVSSPHDEHLHRPHHDPIHHNHVIQNNTHYPIIETTSNTSPEMMSVEELVLSHHIPNNNNEGIHRVILNGKSLEATFNNVDNVPLGSDGDSDQVISLELAEDENDANVASGSENEDKHAFEHDQLEDESESDSESSASLSDASTDDNITDLLDESLSITKPFGTDSSESSSSDSSLSDSNSSSDSSRSEQNDSELDDSNNSLAESAEMKDSVPDIVPNEDLDMKTDIPEAKTIAYKHPHLDGLDDVTDLSDLMSHNIKVVADCVESRHTGEKAPSCGGHKSYKLTFLFNR